MEKCMRLSDKKILLEYKACFRFLIIIAKHTQPHTQIENTTNPMNGVSPITCYRYLLLSTLGMAKLKLS
ncbi:CLUMA_CG005341, isoform A [Clunio marinus]|uniref:CLUMA_CG005341, isoform A n=1 Tax=Clunio marinus TaxID=568069 RepID=A0A1J1HYS7_9DIPT|nr:CLUMA_CG005341, isoform A [Clunio marinus]